MILGNEFVPYYESIGYKASEILRYTKMRKIQHITFLDLLNLVDLDIPELIDCLIFLYMTSYIDYEEGVIIIC